MKIRRFGILLTVLMAGGVGASAQTSTPTINGNVFGGGKMADVGTAKTAGTTATIVVQNSKVTGGVYGGNDIKGTVQQGTAATDASSSVTIKAGTTVGEVYGGGNGYYTYTVNNGTVSVQTIGDSPVEVATYSGTASSPTVTNTSVTIEGGKVGEVYGGAKNAAVTKSGVTFANATAGKVFAGNNFGGSIQTTSLVINSTSAPSSAPNVNDESAWKEIAGVTWGIGEAYGGGNAVSVGITQSGVTTGSTSVTINNGYIKYVFGGNNLDDMKIVPDVFVKHGYIHAVYGGGNAGAMTGAAAGTIDYSTFVSQLPMPEGIYSTILPLFAGTDVMIDDTDGNNSDPLNIGNVFGGCRAANVNNSTYVRVTKATSIGKVFGGCDIAGSVGANPGQLTANQTFTTYKDGKPHATVTIPGTSDTYSVGPSGTFKTSDMIYASTYVLMNGATVGNIYGGGNGNYTYVVSTDEKSVDVYPVGTQAADKKITTYDNYKANSPFVTSSRLSIEGGTVTGNVYGGGNAAEVGHVLTAADISGWTDKKYYGKTYSAGDILSRTSYLLLGSTQRATTTTVKIVGDVYGGGCLANVYGTMDIMVKAGVELKNLYAGNDAAGKVFGKNRGKNTSVNASLSNVGTILMDYSGGTSYLSYRGDNLVRSDENNEIGTYIRVEGAHGDKAAAKIQNIFGGGNGDYNYTLSSGQVTVKTKDDSKTIGVVTASSIADAKPVQQSTFLDIAGEITGSAYGGGNAAGIGISNICIVKDAKVKEAYGGGNSETVTNKANIWVDCNAATSNATSTDYNVLTVFGGNNKAEMAILPTIYLQCGKIGTVYGGGNAGKMSGHDAFALDFTAYKDNECLTADVVKTATVNGKQKTYLPMFSATEVLVDSPYKLDGTTKSLLGGSPSSEDLAKSCGLRINAVYGGCRAADVDNSTYTRITRADYVGNVYAGNDIAGTVGMNPGSVEGSQPVELVAYEVLAGQTDATRYATGVKFPVGSKMVNSGSYVFITGGQIDGNLFGGGNGDYVYTPGATFSESGGNVTLPSTMKKPFSAASFVGVEGGTVKENVFGGGNKVDVGGVDLDSYDKNANPFYDCSHVFIGETARKMSSINLEKSVFGGGNSAGVVRNTHISVDKGSVIKSTLYGGCNSQGTVSGDSKIMVHSGTIGTEGSVKTVTEDEKQVKYLTDAVFGGGFGTNTLVKGNVYVNIKKVSDTSAATIYGNVYGGGNAGPVNTDCNNITETIVEGANIFGEVFGGGYGADVNGAVVLTIKDPTQLNSVEVTQADAKKTLYGNRVFATNNSAGEVKCDATLNFEANSCDMVIYGGGNKAEFKGNTNVVFTKGKVGYIYGGGNLANVVPKTNSSGTVIEPGNTNVYILGGEVCYDVFGGGKNGDVAGTANVYILDDRLTADGEYVTYDSTGAEVLGTSGRVAVDSNTGLPKQPEGWTQSSIKIGGNVYGGGQNGNVGGKANVRVGK